MRARSKKRRRAVDPPYDPQRRANPRQRFAAGCRLAVKADVERFREEYFQSHDNPRCPVTGETLSRSNSHVHHEGPHVDEFNRLVGSFVREQRVNLSKVRYVAGHLLDEQLRRAFVRHHTDHAKLQVVSAPANLGHLRKST